MLQLVHDALSDCHDTLDREANAKTSICETFVAHVLRQQKQIYLNSLIYMLNIVRVSYRDQVFLRPHL